MITLYHGTNEPFDAPDPNRGRRGTDFGQGFYLTPHSRKAIMCLCRKEVKYVS